MNSIQTDTSTTRILVVDDQNLIRETIQVYLERETDLQVIGYAENGKTALEQVEKLAPDIVVLDLEMPDMDGLTAIKIIKDRFSSTKILVLSSHDDRNNINQAIEAGAKGYLTKGTPAKELANAVRSINQGYFQLGPGLMEKLVISISNSERQNHQTLENKLVAGFNKFKQDTNDRLEQLIHSNLADNNEKIEHRFELKLHSFKVKHHELYSYTRKIEFKLYLLILFQVLVVFGLAFFFVIKA